MAYGLERREGQASQEIRPAEQGSIPLAPVQSPNPSSFSRVGENERLLAEALGKASVGINQYVESKKEEWELDGQMAYAEGKTEEEIVARGNRYTTAGFMTMKARTAGNAWLQNALEEIESTDKVMDSGAYQAKLREQYRSLTESIAGKDEFTRRLMGSMAADMFPKLVSQQVKSNNAWREEETGRSATGLLVSEGDKFDPEDPEGVKKTQHLQELMHPNALGLPQKLHRKVVSDAINLGLENNNPAVLNALRGSLRDPIMGSSTADTTLNYIIQNFEGTSLVQNDAGRGKSIYGVTEDFNKDLYAGGKIPTFAQAKQRLKERYYDKVGADALPDNMRLIAVSHAINFGPERANKMITAAKGDPLTLVQLGRMEHERLLKADPKKYGPYAQSWKNRDDALERSIGGVPKETGFNPPDPATLLANGFDASETARIMKSYDSYLTRRSTEFDKNRTVTESDILNAAEKDGNLPGALDKIQQQMQANGYSPSWGNQMAVKAQTAVDKYNTEQVKLNELDVANATNKVRSLGTGEKQQKAIDRKRQEIMTTTESSTATPAEVEATRADLMATYLATNQVVDKVWKSEIEGALSGKFLKPDGSVEQDAQDAFKYYLLLRQKGGAAFADQFLGDAKDLASVALTYSNDGMNAKAALSTASTVLDRRREGLQVNPTVDTKAVEEVTTRWIDSMDVSFFGSGSSDEAADWFDIRPYEIEQGKKDPTLKAFVTSQVIRLLQDKPNLPPGAAMQQVEADLQRRGELVMGNFVYSNNTSTIRQDMGIADDTRTNAVGKAVMLWMKQNGKERWGNQYNKFQYGGNDPNVKGFFEKIAAWEKNADAAINRSIDDKVRGVPAAHITYNPDMQVFIINPYANKEQTVLSGRPAVVPAKEIGDLWRKMKWDDAIKQKEYADKYYRFMN